MRVYLKPVTRYVEYFLVANYKGTVTQKMKGREGVERRLNRA